MPKKPKKPPIEISDEESTFTFSPPSPTPGLFRIGEKRGHPQSSPKNENQNQKPAKKIIRPTTTTDSSIPSPSTPSVPSPLLSPKQHLQKALDSLVQAYRGLKKEEEEEEKDQIKRIRNYIRRILVGKNPFTKEETAKEETAEDVLKGLVEEVRALRKEVAPTKETYAERLKKNLPSSSFLPTLYITTIPYPFYFY
jgi:hypothetical protein